MALRRMTRVLALALLLAVPATAGTTLPVPRATSAAAIAVRLGCYSDPETVTITNELGRPIWLATIGSLYRPRSNEPFEVGRRLNASGVVTFRSGQRAAGNVLTRQFIFNNDVGRAEGVAIVTSVGAFRQRCGARINLPNAGAGTVARSLRLSVPTLEPIRSCRVNRDLWGVPVAIGVPDPG